MREGKRREGEVLGWVEEEEEDQEERDLEGCLMKLKDGRGIWRASFYGVARGDIFSPASHQEVTEDDQKT